MKLGSPTGYLKGIEMSRTNLAEPKTVQENDRGQWFDDGITKAFEYAESNKVVKLDRRAVACDAYLDGFLDGIAYYILERKQEK